MSPLRWLILAVISLLMIGGLAQVRFTDDASAAMLPVDTSWRSNYQNYLDTFPSDQVFILVFEDLICSAAGWEVMLNVDRVLSDLEIVERSHSIASDSSFYVEGSHDSFSVDSFRDVLFLNDVTRCKEASSYPPFARSLVSEDGDAAVMIVFVRSDTNAVEATALISAAIAEHSERANGLGGRIILTGEPVMSSAVAGAVEKDSNLIAVLLLTMLSLTYVLTRSVRLVLITMAMNAFVLVGAIGSIGWLGIMLTPATTLALFLLLPLSSAFCIHAFSYAIREDTRDGGLPVVGFGFAAMSTALGFAATGLTDAGDVRNLAIMGVIGIAFAGFGIALFVNPLIAGVTSSSLIDRAKYPLILLGRPGYFTAIVLGSVVLIAVGLPNLKVNYEPTDYLPSTNAARSDFDAAGQYFNKMTVPAVFELGDVYDPLGWLEVKRIIMETRQDHEFEAVWFYESLSELSEAFSNDGVSAVEFPESRDALFQYLQFVDPVDLELLVDIESSQILVLFQTPYEGSHPYRQFETLVTKLASESDLVSVRFPGRVSAFFDVGHEIGYDTLVGLVISTILVFFVLWYLLGSVTLSIGAVCCNFLPVLIGLSTLGLLDIDVDMGSSIVAAIAFGIILDDSTHLMLRVRSLVRAGYDPYTAVTQAVSDLYVPILLSTIVIVAGFSFLFLAELKMFNDFATVITVTLVAALVSDVLLLPVIIRKLLRDPLTV